MRKLRRFTRLDPRQQWRLICTFAFVVLVRLGLWVLPFGRIRRMLDAGAQRRRPSTQPGGAEADEIVWSVRTASRLVPGASCLTQALVAHSLLDRRGLENELRIGVARSATGVFEAHAWIERNDMVVLGGLEDLDRFTIMPTRPGT
jgi:hypothetical protein